MLRRWLRPERWLHPFSKCLWIAYWWASPRERERESAEPRSGLCPQDVPSPLREQVPLQHPQENNSQARPGETPGRTQRNGSSGPGPGLWCPRSEIQRTQAPGQDTWFSGVIDPEDAAEKTWKLLKAEETQRQVSGAEASERPENTFSLFSHFLYFLLSSPRPLLLSPSFLLLLSVSLRLLP